MPAPTPYLSFPGTAREALGFYREVFGGELSVHTRGEMSGDTEAPDAVAHGELRGPVDLFASDGDTGAGPHLQGCLLALLGAAEPDVLERWFAALAEGGSDVDQLQARPWGDHDGQVTDRFGLRWLIGYRG